ncbi:hypothetical protein ACHAQD_011565 [Fusarium lateritium]
MLCKQCQEAITTANADWELTRIKTDYSRKVTIHNQRAGLESAAEAGCVICREVLRLLLAEERSSRDSSSSLRLQQNTNSAFDVWTKLKSSFSSSKMLSVGVSSKDDLDTQTFMLVPLSANAETGPKTLPNAHLSSTSETDDLWRQWSDTCSEAHSKCRVIRNDESSVFMPKRLVEVISDNNKRPQQWRLVSGADVEEPTYLTLSHCWGWSDHLSLTKQNFHDLTALSPCSMLPKTYRDALFVTVALGKRYIWIDSLCIIQDDEDDWKSQSSVMGSIYKNTACNIANLWAENGSDGLFAPKEEPTLLSLSSEEFSVQQSYYSWPYYHVDVIQAPLNKRAWVVQERYLSLRQLAFGKSQVYWACQELHASEEHPTGMTDSPTELVVGRASALPRGTPDSDNGRVLRRSWAELVKAYSKCELTYLTDKAIALAGIAGEYAAASGGTYLAGLWKQNLENQLCWTVDRIGPYQLKQPSSRPTSLAPTWSWINRHLPIKYDPLYSREATDTKLIEILEASVQSEDPSKLHSFNSSRLRVRGIALWGRFRDPDEEVLGLCEYYGVKPSSMFTLNHPMKDGGGVSIRHPTINIEWDEYQPSLTKDSHLYREIWQERSGQLLILLINLSQDVDIHGLLLKRLSSTEDETVCARLGVIRWWGYDFPKLVRKRLDVPTSFSGISYIDLDNPSLNCLVQEIVIQ